MDELIVQNCNICQECGKIYCHGCDRSFCQKHADEHRQSFYDQLDWLTVDHDDLVQTLNNIPFIKEKNIQSKKIIDQWEEESIRHIRKTANEARRALIDAIKTHIKEVKEKLKLFAEKLNTICHNNNTLFDERNLKQWAMELHTLKDEFLTTPAFTVRVYGNKPIVMPIIKIQPEPIYESHSNEQQQNSFGLVPIKQSTIPQEKSNARISVDHDRFSLNSDHIQLLDHGQVILHDCTKQDGSIRGFHEYSQGVHQLFFRIEHMTSNQWIFFGIISKHSIFNQRAYMNSSVYGWTGYNNVYINGKSIPVRNGYLSEMKVNDLVELIIDCDQQILFFWHSGQSYKTKLPVDIHTCPFPWQFLISCHNGHDSVRILPSSMSSMIKQEQEKLNDIMKIEEIALKK